MSSSGGGGTDLGHGLGRPWTGVWRAGRRCRRWGGGVLTWVTAEGDPGRMFGERVEDVVVSARATAVHGQQRAVTARAARLAALTLHRQKHRRVLPSDPDQTGRCKTHNIHRHGLGLIFANLPTLSLPVVSSISSLFL